jgi:hypothetical protein
MATGEQFWARRLRWRLIGAWRWPLFFVCTLADAFILIGAVAPWLAKRMAARQGTAPAPSFPPANHFEILVDKVASVTLVVATAGLLAAGLGNRKVVVADTDRLARAGEAVKTYVDVHAPPEIQRNIDTLNTHPTQEDGFFRMCVAYDDRTKAYCMFVDAKPKPPTVVPDRDSRPNGVYFRTP